LILKAFSFLTTFGPPYYEFIDQAKPLLTAVSGKLNLSALGGIFP